MNRLNFAHTRQNLSLLYISIPCITFLFGTMHATLSAVSKRGLRKLCNFSLLTPTVDRRRLTANRYTQKRATYQKYAALIIEIASNLLFTLGYKGDANLSFIACGIRDFTCDNVGGFITNLFAFDKFECACVAGN